MFENLKIVEEETCLFIENKSENKKIIFWQKNIFKVTSAMFATFFFLIPLVHFKLIESDYFVTLAKTFAFLGASSFITDLVLRSISITEDSITTLEVNDRFIVVKYLFDSQTHPNIYTFEAENIKQIYITQDVKQLISEKGEQETSYFYELGIEKNNGQKETILSEENLSSEKAEKTHLIMEKSRAYLEKQLYFLSDEKLKNRRKLEQEEELSKLKIQDIQKGFLLDYQHETWEVVEETQYDWEQGNSDKLFELKNAQNKSVLLFVCQNMAIYDTWIEEKFTYQKLVKYKLDKINHEAVLKFDFKGEIFLKNQIDVGYGYIAGSYKGKKIKQHKYLSQDEKQSFRVITHKDENSTFFLGKRVRNFEFNNVLTS
jgi:hypothetical protein